MEFVVTSQMRGPFLGAYLVFLALRDSDSMFDPSFADYVTAAYEGAATVGASEPALADLNLGVPPDDFADENFLLGTMSDKGLYALDRFVNVDFNSDRLETRGRGDTAIDHIHATVPIQIQVGYAVQETMGPERARFFAACGGQAVQEFLTKWPVLKPELWDGLCSCVTDINADSLKIGDKRVSFASLTGDAGDYKDFKVAVVSATIGYRTITGALQNVA
jgi:hypothetical protein